MLAHDSPGLVMVRPLGGTDDETSGILIGVAEDDDGRLHPPITPSLDRIPASWCLFVDLPARRGGRARPDRSEETRVVASRTEFVAGGVPRSVRQRGG